MKIEIININEIKPYENNAKLHPPEQIEQIKKSIIEFGNNDPIAIDENNVIIEGHGRFFALKELDYKDVEVIRLSKLTEQEKKAYILVHNQLTLNTGFDFNKLDAELAFIKNIDMPEFGFKPIDIKEEDYNEDFELPDGDKSDIEQITFTFYIKQFEQIKESLEKINIEDVETFGNTNEKGNKLYEIARQFLEFRGLKFENRND